MANQNALPATPWAIYLVLPILPGKAEAWRRFVQELQGPRRPEWSAWCERAGLRRIRVDLQTHPQQTVALLRANVALVDGRLRVSMSDREPFDRWLREQILALHGIDVALPEARLASEPVLLIGE